jgi:hypothetical protein
VSGVLVQVLGTVMLLAIIGIWDRAVPGTFARLLARLKDERLAPATPPNPES